MVFPFVQHTERNQCSGRMSSILTGNNWLALHIHHDKRRLRENWARSRRVPGGGTGEHKRWHRR